MSAKTTYRLYRYVDAPFQFLGLTIPQVGLLLSGGFFFFIYEQISLKLSVLGLTAVAFSFYASIAKRFQGASWQSFVYWHFGMTFKANVPPSACKTFVGD